MDLNLKNKIALITGASKGIGAAIANTFAAEGVNLYLTARNTKQLETLKIELQKKYSVEDAYLTKILEILEENPFQNNDLNRLFKPKLSKSQKLVLRELNNQLRLISEKNQICSHLIANQSDLKRLVRKEHKDIKILSGWRYNLFGELACNIADHFANK